LYWWGRRGLVHEERRHMERVMSHAISGPSSPLKPGFLGRSHPALRLLCWAIWAGGAVTFLRHRAAAAAAVLGHYFWAGDGAK
jgi:hypothetical protein